MKFFWLVIVVLVLSGGAAFVARTDRGATSGAPLPAPSADPASPAGEEAGAPAATTAPTTPTTAPATAATTASTSGGAGAASAEAQPALTRAAPGSEAAQAQASAAAPAGELDLDAMLGTSAPRIDMGDASGSLSAGTAPGAAAPGASQASPTPVPEVPAKFGEWDVAPATFASRDDGSLLVDGRFIVRGAGTPEDPLRVPWDLLTSAQETFDPANRLVTMPARVAMLHEKTIRIDGYVAFPMMSPRPTELLAMLNQWDGCCLGAPPTAYDAVEVKLLKPVTGDDRFAINGHVVGEFRVEPFVSGSAGSQWLVGMYTMRNALFVSGEMGSGPAH